MFWRGETSCEVKLCPCLILVLILSGCTNTSTGPEATAVQDIGHKIVSEDAVVAFLEILEAGDYHDVNRSGEE